MTKSASISTSSRREGQSTIELSDGANFRTAFRARVLDREPLIGSFVKTPAPQVIEVCGVVGLDFVIVDIEHGPFDRFTLDLMIMAGQAASLPVMVRVPYVDSEFVGASLDSGAAGVVVPHVTCVEVGERAVSVAKFRGGKRGVSSSTRAGDYGAMPFRDYTQLSDSQTSIWAQIEDQQGVANVTEITSVDGIDCVFVGRVDLAHALGKASVDDPLVKQSAERICQAAANSGKAAALFATSISDQTMSWFQLGMSILVVGSDQSVLRAGLEANVRQLHGSKRS